MQESLEQLRSVLSELGESDDRSKLIESVRNPLESLRIRSGELGIKEVESASSGLQRYLAIQTDAEPSVDSMMVFNFALSTMIEAMGNGEAEQTAAGFQSRDVLGMLDLPEEPAPSAAAQSDGPDRGKAAAPEDAVQESSPAATTGLDFSRLRKVVAELGGTLEATAETSPGGAFTLSFPATESSLNQIETLFFPLDVELGIAPKLAEQDQRIREMLNKVKEFMQAMSEADLTKGQAILFEIAEQKHQAGLYQEIGTMARGLHTSLQGFIHNLDPALKDMVEDQIPDSGSRLEHILKLTENAANTTLDNVEKMQQNNQKDRENLAKIGELFQQLKAIGEPAQRCLTSGTQMIQELQESARSTHDRLITVLTAQDYQDLTGQVILKIINLLNDLEQKLVGVISTFGVRVDGTTDRGVKDELYGPAHEGIANALGSQDDVDALLAGFGF